MDGLGGILPIVLIVAVFYFLIIRPQQKQQKERQQMLDSLQKNDEVITLGGIHGTIKEVNDDELKLKIAENLTITMSRFGVQKVISKEEE